MLQTSLNGLFFMAVSLFLIRSCWNSFQREYI